jgi:hypothetical protein
MPYELNMIAPDVLYVNMYGHIGKETAEDYLPNAWKILDGCSKSTNILTDIRNVSGNHPSSRSIIEKLKHHPNVGIYVFIVPAYMLVFAPMVKILANAHLYGSLDDALAFLQRETGISSQATT